jgi:hypothetical protein
VWYAFLESEDAMDTLEIGLVLRTSLPITWSVEAFDPADDGTTEMAQFSGPRAEQRAREYAIWKYGVLDPPIMAA